ncbi:MULTISPECIES: EpsG family protein [Acinetobacter]|uniref:EpsG family protein n=1 Tax=Acinetobacter TaxID=469 RepID=UPI0005CA1448|nr:MULTISPECIES: EpsG family protein [Acinetobacter]MDC5575323.1 EpsG family protein [Acinetobacter baumannii]MBJ8448093.1 EpsG family protein [Acinetobacter pittii]MBJ9450393.1 EpsG family protein [Acinetobacter pittii]MCU4546202.1 EpsG family protein [Acinetobacter pittii]MDR0001908.1 EpsG family protein [Acinetobacter sp. 11367]
MYLYIFLIFLVLFISILPKLFGGNYSNKISMIVIIVLSSLMPAFRDITIGTDTYAYVEMFKKDYSYLEWLENGTELGFAFCIKLLQSFGFNNYFNYLLFFSILFNYLIISTIYKISKNIPLSLMAFLSFSTLYLFHFNVLRQSIALAFFVYSLPYIFSKQYFKTYVCIFLAFLFHYSAGLLFVFPIVYGFLKDRFYTVSALSTLSLYIYTKLTIVFTLFLGNAIGSDRYSSYDNQTTANASGKIFLFNFFILFLVYLFSLFTKLKDDLEFRFFNYLMLLMVVTNFCITYLGLKYEGPGRILSYFYCGLIFIFPYLASVFRSESRVVVNILLIAFQLLYILFLINMSNLHEVFPYKINNFLS